MERKGWVDFDYQLDSDEIPRPFISFKLRCLGSSSNIEASGVVDSGAERTLLIADFAQALDIRLTEITKVPIYGLGDDDKTYGYPATVELLVDGFDEYVEMNIFFVKDLKVSGLLGQGQFFNQFNVSFDKRNGKTWITKNPSLVFHEEIP